MHHRRRATLRVNVLPADIAEAVVAGADEVVVDDRQPVEAGTEQARDGKHALDRQGPAVRLESSPPGATRATTPVLSSMPALERAYACVMDVRSRMLGGLARQAGHPGGLVGRVMGAALNLGDRKDVAAAVDALTIPARGVVADVGFGGGVGLRFLLDRVSGDGKVHGVEISSVMLSSASRRFGDEIARGQLELHRASITDLPFGSAVVDGVITTHPIYFVAELDRAFSEIANALKSSGQPVIGLGDPTR